jgi:hypothetical protein
MRGREEQREGGRERRKEISNIFFSNYVCVIIIV